MDFQMVYFLFLKTENLIVIIFYSPRHKVANIFLRFIFYDFLDSSPFSNPCSENPLSENHNIRKSILVFPAFITTIHNFFPVFLPFFAPRKRALTGFTYFFRKIYFFMSHYNIEVEGLSGRA